MADAEAAYLQLSAPPRVRGGLGIVGLCLVGTIAYFLAARVKAEAPIQFHFGGNDPYILREEVARVEKAASDRDNAEIHVEDAGHAFHSRAGHAFHSRKAPMFNHHEAAAGRGAARKSSWPCTCRCVAGAERG